MTRINSLIEKVRQKASTRTYLGALPTGTYFAAFTSSGVLDPVAIQPGATEFTVIP